MKRLFTLIICVLLLQIVKASPSTHATIYNPASETGHLLTDKKVVNTDTIIVPVVNNPVAYTPQSGIYKRRLDSIKKDVPLDYNDYVQSYINIYAASREDMGRVIGASKYYFPIYEKAFRDAGIPDEIKYLSIVESKLDPYAVSRVGATGPWQFMYTTGKLYGLSIDDYVDDRRDPIQASYAAAAYLKDAYQEFGDWLLAIASYNCGKSNVEHALEKAGGSGDFWAIRQYLPNETRGYVPAFIAVAYVMNYYKQHNIVPQACNYSLKTDTVLVNKYVPLSTVSRALNVDLHVMTMLNPAYKRQIVNGSNKAPRRMVIPEINKEQFSALYDVLNNGGNGSPAASSAAHVTYASYHVPKAVSYPSYHVVQKGEKLGDIAATYNLNMSDLKEWNHLHSNKAVVGQKLKLSASADEPEEKTTSVRHHEREEFITYKVKTGDTISGIASKFDGATVERIRSVNGLKKDRLQPGMKIRIATI